MYEEKKRNGFRFSLVGLILCILMVSFVGTALCIDGIATFGIVGAGEYLGAKNANQAIIPVIGVDANGNTSVKVGTAKTVALDSLGGTASETIAGAGSTVADAAQLSATLFVHRITGANGTLGWKFSASTPINSVQIVLNTTAGVAKLYAESGGTINGGAADAAFSALTGIKPIICYKTAALTYICA